MNPKKRKQKRMNAAAVATGLMDDGYPWIGSKDPPLVVTGFVYYLWFQCNNMHSYLRQIIAHCLEKIKIFHRHFPMDNTVNPIVQKSLHHGAGSLALLAIYAGTEDQFWQMNDYLFANARGEAKIDQRTAADSAGMNDKKLALSLRIVQFDLLRHWLTCLNEWEKRVKAVFFNMCLTALNRDCAYVLFDRKAPNRFSNAFDQNNSARSTILLSGYDGTEHRQE